MVVLAASLTAIEEAAEADAAAEGTTEFWKSSTPYGDGYPWDEDAFTRTLTGADLFIRQGPTDIALNVNG